MTMLRPSLAPSLTALPFVALLGCSSTPEPKESSTPATPAEKVSHRDFDRGEKILFARRAAEMQDCVDPMQPNTEAERACTARVRASWKPIERFLIEMHRVWCEAKPEDCPTGGKLPDPPEAEDPQPKKAPPASSAPPPKPG